MIANYLRQQIYNDVDVSDDVSKINYFQDDIDRKIIPDTTSSGMIIKLKMIIIIKDIVVMRTLKILYSI